MNDETSEEFKAAFPCT